MSKARDLADSAQEINILDGKSFLDEDNLASDSATGIASQQSIKAYVDGITTTNITSTGALNSGSITSGFGNIDNGSSTITTTGAISGGSFVIGSADINENDLESIDGITAGTVAASKAVVVNANKDITGFRNLTATGTINGTLSGAIASTTTATTQAEADDSTKVATTAYVTDKITTLIGGAPSTLNDLNELAAAINDDANYNSTLTTALATKLPLAGGALTGAVTTNSTFDGRNVSVDGSKLDGIEANATADQTAAQILTALKTVDGSGSGLDADLIDGLSSGDLIRSNAADVKSSGDLNFSDSVKATFGASSDLQIYHDGSDSRIIENGAGDLYIGGASNIRFVNSAVNATYAMFTEGGKVQLNYNDSKRFETTDAGVTVTGNVVVSGTVDGRDVASDGSKLDGVASSANNYSHPNHSGEVTSSGDGAMTIANNVVDEANLKVSNGPTNGYFLSAQSGNTGGLTWAEVAGGGMTFLGSVAVTSSSAESISVSSLNLSGYKQVYITCRFLNCSQNQGFRLQNNHEWYQIALGNGGGSADNGNSWEMTCDLATGITYSSPCRHTEKEAPNYTNPKKATGAAVTFSSGGNPNPNITTSTTTITLYTRSGYPFTYTSNTSPQNEIRDMRIYGIK